MSGPDLADLDTFLTLDEFLDGAERFRLGRLPTEQPHPMTANLAELARHAVASAIEIFCQVDRSALGALATAGPRVEELATAVRGCLADGQRVFLCGCGATGRLALSLETLWRERAPKARRDAVLGFMAGGDTALISSIEGFEDHPEYGKRHLDDVGFAAGDLLISCTEGGETPYVLGATEAALRRSRRPPWLFYCNPDSALMGIERSRRLIQDERVQSTSLDIGPMALAGSTRLQATTVLMLAVGWALLEPADGGFAAWLERYLRRVRQIDFTALAPLTEAEADAYDAGDYVTYETSRYAITVLTDTTERAPTFNLAPFENQRDPSPEPSLCYLALPDADDAEAAWRQLLARPPRPLDWPEYTDVAGSVRLIGFDLSRRAHTHRRDRLPQARHHRFLIERRGDRMALQFRKHTLSVPVDRLSPLQEHVLLKLLLNCHSTLLMGRLGRFQSNVMTWVKPSNRKLIDRAIRYVEQLLTAGDGPRLSYEETARALFRQIPKLAPDRSIVLETVAAIRAAHDPSAGSIR